MKTIMFFAALCVSLAGSTLAQEDNTIYKVGDGVSPPKLVRQVGPHYTSDAMRRGVTGTVILQCVVDREGVPTNIEVVQPLDEDLDQAAHKALQQWRFEPGKKDGKAVLVQVDVKMFFTMPKRKGGR